MRRMLCAALAAAMLVPALPAAAQEGEVIVTASRRPAGFSDMDAVTIGSERPAPELMLRRTADFAVQPVRVTGDTRDETRRRDEIYAMLRGAIQLAARHGVALSTGDYIVEPLTLANYTNLTLEEDDERDDAEGAAFLVKVPLKPGIDAKGALERIAKFLRAVPAVGRAEIVSQGDLTLSVVSPDQYRGAIVDLVAADAAKATARFGSGYAVTVTGLDRPVEWQRAGLTEVTLFLPVAYTVVPRR